MGLFEYGVGGRPSSPLRGQSPVRQLRGTTQGAYRHGDVADERMARARPDWRGRVVPLASH